MYITPDMVARAYAGLKYDAATTLYDLQQEQETSLVEQNAAAFSAECERLGIEAQPDDSERYIDESDAWGVSVG